MTSQPGPNLPEALAALAGAFRDLRRPAMLIGGLAVIARGIPRQTIDIDAVVQAEAQDIETLVQVFERWGFTARIPDAVAFARQCQVLLLRHEPSGVPLDLSLGWLPFEWEAMSRATPVDLAGVTLPVATAEDLVVFKAIAWRDRDRGDIERLDCDVALKVLPTEAASEAARFRVGHTAAAPRCGRRDADRLRDGPAGRDLVRPEPWRRATAVDAQRVRPHLD